jgi:ribosomal protein S18 acetylase RimI-like enzyme
MIVAIRPATPDDAAAIARLHVETHRATYAPLIDGRYDAPSFDARLVEWRAILTGPGVSFVATEQESIVGVGHADGDRIEPLHVAPSHHRRGIGRALMRHMLEGLRARSAPTAVFNVLALNTRAIAFYEALGARRIGMETMSDAPMPYQDIVYRIDTAPI